MRSYVSLSSLVPEEGWPHELLSLASNEDGSNILDYFANIQSGVSTWSNGIAGSIVTEGYVKRSLPIRVLRENVVIYEGELESLRRFKDDVNEVRSGTECGIGVKNYNDVKVGDQIECFERVEFARSLD